MGFIDDLAGALYDVLKFMLWVISYLLVGAVIVAVPMYSVVWLIGLFR